MYLFLSYVSGLKPANEVRAARFGCRSTTQPLNSTPCLAGSAADGGSVPDASRVPVWSAVSPASGDEAQDRLLQVLTQTLSIVKLSSQNTRPLARFVVRSMFVQRRSSCDSAASIPEDIIGNLIAMTIQLDHIDLISGGLRISSLPFPRHFPIPPITAETYR